MGKDGCVERVGERMADRRMTKSKYREYLGSQHWQIRRKAFLHINCHCNRCDMPRWLAELLYDQDLHVHHLSYANLGKEKDDDLEALCRRCHDIETHGRSDFRQLKTHPCPDCGAAVFDPRIDRCDFCLGVIEGLDIAEARDFAR